MAEVPRNYRPFIQRLPGYAATVLMALVVTSWTYWGTGEAYHEGWGVSWYTPWLYMIPAAGFLIFTLIALTWPRVGGGLLTLVGIAFTIFFMDIRFVRGRLVIDREWGGFLVSGVVILFGALFLWEGYLKRAYAPDPPASRWWRRRFKYLLTLGLPGLVALVFSAYRLPVVLTRIDDGDRGAREIRGNGATLIWAPEGPGWNWKQPWGGYPSWDMVALYGASPVGLADKPGYGRQPQGPWKHAGAAEMAETDLCRYLSADGLTLMEEPQNIWRMPTVDELVRALGRHGENAGCTWDPEGGVPQKARCAFDPDKETPLWAPNQSPIYYWAAEEYDDGRAYFVCYNGMINVMTKSGGNPRHTYRCVREP